MAPRKSTARAARPAPPTSPEAVKFKEPILSVEQYVAPEIPLTVKDREGNLHVYQMHLMPEMTAIARQKIANIWGNVTRILANAENDQDVTREEEAIVEEGYKRVVRYAVPDMPDDILFGIHSAELERISNHFFTVAALIEMNETIQRSAALRQIGASSSPPSNVSTIPSARKSGSTRTRKSSPPA